ncbi:MAG TPA: glycosyltransferase family 4 protein [Burkholderiaceae bacterium]|nr:glycosyltransferase family 4 protein [Burkholderiaceae bacterium]
MSDRQRRILFIVNSLCVGGAERHVVTLLNHLDTRRFRLSLACLKQEAALLPQLRQERLASITWCNIGRGFEWHAVRKLARLIRAEQIDTLLCTNQYSMAYGYVARCLARRRVRLIEVLHTTLVTTPKEQLQMRLYRPIFRRTDLLIYVSENQRRYWRSQGLTARADCVIHNGIDTDYYSPRPAEDCRQLRAQLGFGPDDYLVGICAVLRPEKHHLDLLEAVHRLRSRGLRACLLIIGDGPERARIEARIAALDLHEQVRISGFQADVRPYIGACDVMALVSQSIETFSLAALESLALGKPIVMSNVGGASEQVVPGVNGLLFEPGDIAALTDCLQRLAEPRPGAQVAQAARDTVLGQFTLAHMLGQFSACLAAEPAGGAAPG